MTTAVKNSFLFMGIISPPHAFKYGFPGKTIAQKNNPLLSHVESADILIVTHLSQIGGSLAEVVKTVDGFIKKRIRFVSLKENIDLNGKRSTQSQAVATIFGALAEIAHQWAGQYVGD